MARDKSSVSQRRRGSSAKVVGGEDDRSAAASNKPRRKKTEEELDEEFEAACEKWCGVVLRVVFAAYSLFGVATSTYEWATRPGPPALDPANSLEGLNVVLTGGCDGIGLHTARLLHDRGARVVVGCRPPPPPRDPTVDNDDADADFDFQPTDAAAADANANANAPSIPLFGDAGEEEVIARRYPLDLTAFASVRSFASRVAADLDTIDVLIHNAGTISVGQRTQSVDPASAPFLHLSRARLDS